MRNLRLFIHTMFMQEHQHQRVLLRVLLFILTLMIRQKTKKVMKMRTQKFKMRIQKHLKKTTVLQKIYKKTLKKMNNQLMWKMSKFWNIVTSKTVKIKNHQLNNHYNLKTKLKLKKQNNKKLFQLLAFLTILSETTSTFH